VKTKQCFFIFIIFYIWLFSCSCSDVFLS